MKTRLRGLIPGIRWIPHDIDEARTAPKTKSHRSIFSRRLSSSSDSQHGNVKRRKSTISLTSMADAEIDARTHAQAQSMFFAMLPLEMRKTVYEYVMGEEIIHLTFSAKKRFGHFLCEGHRAFDGRECGCRVLVGGKESDKLSSASVRILRTCRRLYSEAVSHLYRPHTFSLLHLTHLLYLPSSLPQPRLNTIRTLRLRLAIRALPYLRRGDKIAYREDTLNWEKAWRIMAELAGLRDLFVVLIDPSPQSMWEESWLELQGKLLEPVKSVTRPRWFELVLPYASCNTAVDMSPSRVVLRKPQGGSEIEDED